MDRSALSGVAKRVQELRHEKSLSKSELAGMAGLSVACISNIENHANNIPITTLLALCKGLETTPNDLLGFSDA